MGSIKASGSGGVEFSGNVGDKKDLIRWELQCGGDFFVALYLALGAAGGVEIGFDK